MVASEKEKVLWMLNFICKEKTNTLDRLFSSVNIVSQEEIVSVTGKSSILEEFDEVRELTMNVSTYLDGSFQFEEHGLRKEDLSGFQT